VITVTRGRKATTMDRSVRGATLGGVALRSARHLQVCAAVAVVLAGVVGLAGCGSRSPSATPTPTPATSSPATPASPTGSATAPTSDAAAIAEITKNWQTFFNKDTTPTEKLALLENGSKLQQAIAIFGSDPRLKEASAKVVKVEVTSPTQATVTYNVLLNGAVALPNSQGVAVLQNGMWKVSTESFCALAALGHSGTIPGCS
jgi:hypothetical protein